MPAIPYAILGYGRNRRELQRAIDAATYINVGQLRDGRAPLWWDDTARYERERHETLPGVERIQTAEELSAMGKGDCDDHGPALAASLQVCGIPARAVVIESPGVGYHVVVVTRDADGNQRVLDPSARRGMLMGEATGTRRERRRRKMLASIERAGRLVERASRMAPGSAAARALASEARRLLVSAEQDRETLDEEREESEARDAE